MKTTHDKMEMDWNPRQILVYGLIALSVMVAGCMGGADPDPYSPSTSTSPESQTETAHPATACPRSLPEPPTEANVETAREFAEQYEANRTYNQVCNHEKFGLVPTTAGKIVRVERVTNGGVFVFAQQPFYYSGDDAGEADGALSSIYFVGNGSFTRTDFYGAPQRHPGVYAPNDSPRVDQGQSIRLFNLRNDSAEVTLHLNYTDESPPETALNETYSLGGTSGIRLLEVAARPGDYTLTVTTDAGASEQLSLGLSVQPIAVYIAPNGDLHVFPINGTASRRVATPPQ